MATIGRRFKFRGLTGNLNIASYTLICLQLFQPLSAQIAADTGSRPGEGLSGTLEFSGPKTTILGRSGTVMTGLIGCSNGTAFLQTVDLPGDGDFVLHSLDVEGSSTAYQLVNLPKFHNIGPPTRFSANSSHVAELVTAQPRDSYLHGKEDEEDQIILVFKKNGEFESSIVLPRTFKVGTIGVFPESRSVLAVGLAEDGKSAQVRVYSFSGSELKSFGLFDNDPNASSPKGKLTSFEGYPFGELHMAQLAGFRKNLLLVPSMTRLPLLEISEEGVVRALAVQLPQGLTLDTVLSSSPSQLWLKTFSAFSKNPPSAMLGPILAINPYDGSLIQTIMPRRDHVRIVCEDNGVFLGVSTNHTSGALEYRTGTLTQ